MSHTLSLICICGGLLVVAIPLFVVLTNFIINRSELTKGRKTVGAYLVSIEREDFTEAAKYVSPLILSDAPETVDWISKMAIDSAKGRLVDHELRRATFRTRTGNFAGEVYVQARLRFREGSDERLAEWTIKLVEDRQTDQLYVVEGPGLTDEARERLVSDATGLVLKRKTPKLLPFLVPDTYPQGKWGEALVENVTQYARNLVASLGEGDREVVGKAGSTAIDLVERAAAVLPGKPRNLMKGLVLWDPALGPRINTPEDLAAEMAAARNGFAETGETFPAGSLDALPLEPSQRESLEETRKWATAVWLEMLAERDPMAWRLDKWRALAGGLLMLLAADTYLRTEATVAPASAGE